MANPPRGAPPRSTYRTLTITQALRAVGLLCVRMLWTISLSLYFRLYVPHEEPNHVHARFNAQHSNIIELEQQDNMGPRLVGRRHDGGG